MAHYNGRYIKGNPLFHPPIPPSWDQTTSSRPPDQFSTGHNPGPGSVGPIDPRLAYPRVIEIARPRGLGCSSCKWMAMCLQFNNMLNFGTVDHEIGSEGKLLINPDRGTRCESWNLDLSPLPPEDFNSDGLGLGDPVTAGTLPEDALNQDQYLGQYGQGRNEDPDEGDLIR